MKIGIMDSFEKVRKMFCTASVSIRYFNVFYYKLQFAYLYNLSSNEDIKIGLNVLLKINKGPTKFESDIFYCYSYCRRLLPESNKNAKVN